MVYFNYMYRSTVRSRNFGGRGSFSYPRGAGRGNGSRNGRQPRPIDVRSFINKAVDMPEVEVFPITHSFDDFDIDAKVKTNIAQKGYTIPTPIQDQGIIPILGGRDFLGIANTGTGKTGAFLIPLINKMLNDKQQKVLVMVPTRELAIQINHEFQGLASMLSLWSVLAIGGTSMYQQRRSLESYHNFLISTPGRLKDLVNQRLINLSQYKTVVLDEVDRMLDMGFIKDMRDILSQLPNERQSLFFSATMTNQVMGLIQEFAHNLVSVSVKRTESADTIEQDVIPYSGLEDKMEKLHQLLISNGVEKALIFGRTKHGVQRLSEKLNDRGFRSDAIHGNKSQPQRQRALLNFRQNKIKVLVATDVAARGLDIADVTHVINFDVPESKDDYIHRIGRTGRANKRGIALTFVGQ